MVTLNEETVAAVAERIEEMESKYPERVIARTVLYVAQPRIEEEVHARIRTARQPIIERLERIRDLDEQTSDGALGSIARYALDELRAVAE